MSRRGHAPYCSGPTNTDDGWECDCGVTDAEQARSVTPRQAGADAVRRWSAEDIDRAAAVLVDAMAPAVAEQQDGVGRRSA